MKKILPSFIGLIFWCLFVKGQTDRYEDADAFVRNYPVKITDQHSLDVFIGAINKKFTAEVDKARAAFYWISENISYHQNAVNDKNYKQTSISALIQSGEALCGGYASLMEYFCKQFGMECVTINGTGRSLYADIVLNPDKLIADHAWNAVKINGEWKLMDVTWGSGYTDYSTGVYHKSRNEKYFFSDPQTFVYKHLPLKPEWQLLDSVVSAEEFCNQPFIDEGYSANHITAAYPFRLGIDKQEGDTIHFKFKTNKPLNYIVLQSLDNKINETGFLKSSGGYYSFIFKAKKEGEFDLRVSLFYMDTKMVRGFVSYSPALIYRLRVKAKQ